MASKIIRLTFLFAFLGAAAGCHRASAADPVLPLPAMDEAVAG